MIRRVGLLGLLEAMAEFGASLALYADLVRHVF